MSWSPKDVAAMAARLEAQGVRQSAAFYEGLRQAAQAPGASPTEATQARGSKFGNVRCELDGITFDSLAERDRYLELQLLARAGTISDLRPSPEQPKKDRFKLAGGITYTPDFTYMEGGRRVAEDVKGGKATATAHFRDKARLFREAYPGIELRIVER